MEKRAVLAFVAAGLAASAFAARRVSFDCDTLDIAEYRAYATLSKDLGATHLAACQICSAQCGLPLPC